MGFNSGFKGLKKLSMCVRGIRRLKNYRVEKNI